MSNSLVPPGFIPQVSLEHRFTASDWIWGLRDKEEEMAPTLREPLILKGRNKSAPLKVPCGGCWGHPSHSHLKLTCSFHYTHTHTHTHYLLHGFDPPVLMTPRCPPHPRGKAYRTSFLLPHRACSVRPPCSRRFLHQSVLGGSISTCPVSCVG